MENSLLKVLLIDDNRVNLQYLSDILSAAGYETITALEGEDGLQKVKNYQPHLILLDIIMPGMDGFEVCRKLKAEQGCNKIPVIFLSSRSDTQTIVKAFQTGGIDYVKKPFVKEEVLARVKAHIKIGLLNNELSRKNQILNEKQKHIDTDLKAAGEIQRNLLPREGNKFPGVDIQWLFQPSEMVGGDIFNVIPINHDYLAFYILDVSGHGVPSALVATSVAQALLPHSGLITREHPSKKNEPIASPGQVLASLDKYFPLERFDKFFTILFGYLHLPTGKLQYSHGAHPFGYLVHRNSQLNQMDKGGSIIGIQAGIPFQEGHAKLEKDDKVFIYTDGLSELPVADGSMFGDKKLPRLLREHKKDDAATIVKAIQQEIASGRQQTQKDDISLMCIGYNPEQKSTYYTP